MSENQTSPQGEAKAQASASKAITANPQFSVTQKAITKMLSFWPTTVPGKDRFVGVALSIALNDPAVARCSLRSKLICLATSARLGLVPDPVLGHAYLIPFKNEAKFIPGYKGLITLAHRCGAVRATDGDVVYSNDRFEYRGGTDPMIIHQPHWLVNKSQDQGEFFCAWVVCTMPGGEKQATVMSAKEINAIKGRSAARNSGPWVTDEDQMRLKTVIRRAMKFVPLSAEHLAVAQAIAIDSAVDAGDDTPQVFDEQDIIDAEVEEADSKPAEGRTKV